MKKRIVIGFLIVSLVLFLGLVGQGALANSSRLVDGAGLLSQEEGEDLASYLDEISERQGMDVLVHTTRSLAGKSPRAYADDYFDYGGYGIGPGRDGLVLVISMEERELVISTHGWAIEVFTDQGLEWILDDVAEDLSRGDYYGALMKFGDLADSYIDQARGGQAYDIGNKPRKAMGLGSYLLILIISLGLGLISAWSYLASLMAAHKTKRSQVYADSYQSSIVGGARGQEDFISSNVTRVPIPRNDNQGPKGGSSTTWTSSSGGTHGGASRKF